jgi:hypothetical protein
MLTATQRNEQAIAVEDVFKFSRRHDLTLADLTDYGGEDLADRKREKKARLVEKTWALMARLDIAFKHLE